jgi:hypothetical protein
MPVMKPSREFKANFTAWGFFILSLLLVALVAVVVWHSRTSSRPVPEHIEK